MKYLWLLVFLYVIAIIAFIVPLSLALEPAQEKEYQRAKILLKEGKPGDAQYIFSKLAKGNPSDFKFRFNVIDTTIEQARVLKTNKNPRWKDKIYQAFGDLKSIYRANTSSPAIYLLFAKCYWVNERLRKAERSLRKAFYFNPDYTDAFIFRGDMYFEETKKFKRYGPKSKGLMSKGKNSKSYGSNAKNSYEKALSGTDIDTETKAMVYFKLGNTYYDFYKSENKAKEQWNKAFSIASESFWGKKAKERLSSLE